MLGAICSQALLVLHLGTAHANPAMRGDTYGLGLECRFPLVQVAAGRVRNSFGHPAVYVLAGRDIWQVQRLHIGWAAGVATGYLQEREPPWIGGLRLRLQLGAAEIGALAWPVTGHDKGGYVHFTLSWVLA